MKFINYRYLAVGVILLAALLLIADHFLFDIRLQTLDNFDVKDQIKVERGDNMRFIPDRKTQSIIAVGKISETSPKDLVAALEENSWATTLVLNSDSMEDDAAWSVLLMREVVWKHELNTVALGECSSGCASVFNTGIDRKLGNLDMATPDESDLVDFVSAFKRHVSMK